MVKVRIDITGWNMWEHGIPDSRLTVIKQAEDYIRPNGQRVARYLCKCNCGSEKTIIARLDSIKNGSVKSCGCLSAWSNSNKLKQNFKNTGYSDEKLWTVYMHTNKINGKKYIGITSQNPPKRRWRDNGSGYKDNVHFWNAIKKYGWDNFKHEILLQHEELEYAFKVEKCLIRHYKTNNRMYGYNLTTGGEGCSGIVVSEETREKLRIINSGKTIPQETRDKISKANKGRKKSAKERQAISQRMSLRVGELNNHYGKPHSEESKRKISESNKKAHANPEVKAKISKANKGKNHGNIIPLYCPELDQYFWGGQDVFEQYGIRHVLEVRNKSNKTAGKHPDTGEKLHWIEVTIEEYENYISNLQKEMVI